MPALKDGVLGDDYRSKRGRPVTTGTGVVVAVRMSPEQLAAVDKFADAKSDCPSCAEAMRRLVTRGLSQ